MHMSLHFLLAVLQPLRSWGRWSGVRPVLWTLALCLTWPAAAQNAGQTLDHIKAAYVYNFAKFVELPGADDLPIRLCVVGKDDPHGRMFSLNRRIAQKREILVRRDVPLDQLKDCGMVFVAAADTR